MLSLSSINMIQGREIDEGAIALRPSISAMREPMAAPNTDKSTSRGGN